MNKKYIYILTNTHSKDIVKIGKTDKYPEIRAEQLNKQTGTIGKYEVVWFKEVPNNDIAEKIIHYCLKELNIQNEYFDIDKDTAIKVAENLTNSFFETIKLQQDFLKKILNVNLKSNESTGRIMKLLEKYTPENMPADKEVREEKSRENIKKYKERLKKLDKENA